MILGGARSGKSQFAQNLAQNLEGEVLFVATGEAGDEEMQYRIEEHKKRRSKSWRTLEVTQRVGKRIAEQLGSAKVVIIDCLTLLTSNILMELVAPTREITYLEAESRVMSEINELVVSMNELDASFILVSNEVGLGLVPENKLGRIYRDLLGKVNQLLAQQADEVYLLVAGIPLKVK